jgi:hypothetical protein
MDWAHVGQAPRVAIVALVVMGLIALALIIFDDNGSI